MACRAAKLPPRPLERAKRIFFLFVGSRLNMTLRSCPEDGGKNREATYRTETAYRKKARNESRSTVCIDRMYVREAVVDESTQRRLLKRLDLMSINIEKCMSASGQSGDILINPPRENLAKRPEVESVDARGLLSAIGAST